MLTRQRSAKSPTESQPPNDQPVGNAVEPKHQRRTFLVLFVILLLDLIGFTMILPLFPSILEYYAQQKNNYLYQTAMNFTQDFRRFIGAPDSARWNSVLFGGILGSMFSFLQFLSSPIVGSLSDVFGRKPLLILTMAGLAFSYLLWSFSGASFALFCLSRVVGGLCKSNVGVATAVVSDVSTSRSRGRGMALIGVAFSLGFLFGPLLGVFYSVRYRQSGQQTYCNPAILAFTLAVAACFLLAVAFKETLPKEKRSKQIRHGLQQSLSLINPISLFSFSSMYTMKHEERSSVKNLGLAYFIYLFIYSGLEFNLTFLTHVQFNYTSVEQGKMFCIMGVIMILVQGGFVRRIPAGKELKMAIIGIMIAVPAFILLGISSSRTMFYVGLVLFSVASGIVVTCLTSRVSLTADQQHQGRVLGILRSLGALARSLGPIVASLGFWSCGPRVVYCTGAVLLTVPITILSRQNRL